MVDSILRQLQVGCISRIKWDCAVNLYTNFGLCKYLLKNIIILIIVKGGKNSMEEKVITELFSSGVYE